MEVDALRALAAILKRSGPVEVLASDLDIATGCIIMDEDTENNILTFRYSESEM